MTTTTPAATGFPREAGGTPIRVPVHAETKTWWKSTEFWVYIASVIGVLIASQLVGDETNRPDYFRADRAWLYITMLSIGYMIGRGLAKAGSPREREPAG